jgi:hypothetical protein
LGDADAIAAVSTIARIDRARVKPLPGLSLQIADNPGGLCRRHALRHEVFEGGLSVGHVVSCSVFDHLRRVGLQRVLGVDAE